MSTEKIITPKEAGVMLNRSTKTIYSYINKGIIRAYPIVKNGNLDVPLSEVERLLHTRTQSKMEG